MPSTSLTVLDAGQAVQVISREGDFAQVQTADGKTGFVFASRLQAPPGSSETMGTNQVLTASTNLQAQIPAAAEPEPPRDLLEIMRERDQLNALYVSADGKLTKLRPRGAGPFFDAASGQAFWLAFTCHNAACLQQGMNGKPFLFSLVSGKYNVNPNGTLVADGPSPRFTCPLCGGNETVRPYVLPETERRMKELDAEHQRQIKVRNQGGS